MCLETENLNSTQGDSDSEVQREKKQVHSCSIDEEDDDFERDPGTVRLLRITRE